MGISRGAFSREAEKDKARGGGGGEETGAHLI